MRPIALPDSRSRLFSRFPLSLLLATFLAAAWPAVAPAQPAAAPGVAPAASAITPYVDDTTLLVLRIDPAAIDWDAGGNWVTDLLKAARFNQKDMDAFSGGMRQQLPRMKKWTADFAKAGGKSVYVLARLNSEAPAYAVVPLGAGADSKALSELLKDPFGVTGDGAAGAAAGPGPAASPLAGMKSLVVGNALYFGPDGALSDVKEFVPAARPELERAFADAGDAQVRVAFNPTEGARGVVVLNVKKLPDELGGGPVAPVVNGLRWLSLAIHTPAAASKASIQVTVQAKDAAAAKTLSGVVDAAHKSAAAARPPAGAAGAPPVDWLFDTLAPKVAADKPDQLRVSLDDAKLKDLVVKLVPAMQAARRAATRVKSMSNEKQILLGIMMYANEKHDAMPKNLPADLKSYLGGDDKGVRTLFTNPGSAAGGGYVYARPAEKLTDVKNPSETPVLWEAYEQWGDGVNVGFMDGHVQRVMDKAEFDKFLANNPNAAKAEPVKP